MRDPRAHKQAVEKQKQINNARDVLKKWFEHNPTIPPPRTNTPSGSAHSRSGSSSQSSQHHSGQSQSTGSSRGSNHNSQTNYSRSSGKQSQNTYQHNATGRADSGSGSSHQRAGAAANQKAEDLTGWFVPSDLDLTPLQKLARKLGSEDARSNSDQTAIIGFVLGFAAIFGPIWLIGMLVRLVCQTCLPIILNGLN
jgi:hypothetical protein